MTRKIILKYFLLVVNSIYCINAQISNNDVKAVSHVIDFQQCVQNCNLNQENIRDCKLNCYINFGSLGYRNNFSFGVAPDKLLFDINNQVKAFKINDSDANNDEVKISSLYDNAKSLLNTLNQKYIKSVNLNDENAPLTKENLLELFKDDKLLSDAFNYISNDTYYTLKQLTKNINNSQKTHPTLINTLLYTSLNNQYGDLMSKFNNNNNGEITKNIIDSTKDYFSENECISRCDISSQHLTSVFSNTINEFNEEFLNENDINEIYQHCIKQCKYINSVYDLYGNITINEINRTHLNKRNILKKKLLRSNENCATSMVCKMNQNNIMECEYEDNKPFFNRIDGCSVPNEAEWTFVYDKSILLPSCNGHDACYHCNPIDTNPNSNKESLVTDEYLSCNKKFRENGEKACDSYNYGSTIDTIKGKIKCYQEVESMVLAVDVAGWESYSNDRNFANNDTTGCLCNGSIRKVSAQNFIVNGKP